MIITTRNGKEILVDEDFLIPIGMSVNVASNGYPRLLKSTGKKRPAGSYIYEQIYFHQYIAKPRKGYQVDHINGNKLDNRRKNLRICLNGSNNRNKKKYSGEYKGVHRDKRTGRWVAQITKNYRAKHLGTFSSAEEAAIAYNKSAKILHGKYAVLNIIKYQETNLNAQQTT